VAGDIFAHPMVYPPIQAHRSAYMVQQQGGLTGPVLVTIPLVRLGAPEDEPESVL